MIEIAQLNEKYIGRWVIYTAGDGHTEAGRIKSWNDSGIFVVYNTGGNWRNYKDYTAAHTPPDLLRFATAEDHVGE